MANLSYHNFMVSQQSMKGPPTPEQLTALDALFSDSQAPVSDIAQAINRPYIEAIKENPSDRLNAVESQCARIWRTINNAVKQLTEQNDRLVQLVLEMLKASDPTCAEVLLHDFHQEWVEFAWDCKSRPWLMALLSANR